MKRNLQILKEAISDARTLRETAIANAKASLEEAFTPHLKTMLSTKLQEMEDEENKIDETKEIEDEGFHGSKSLGGEKEIEEVPVDEVKGEKSLGGEKEIEEVPIDEEKMDDED